MLIAVTFHTAHGAEILPNHRAQRTGSRAVKDADGVVFHEGEKPAQGAVTAQVATSDQRLLKDVATVVSAVVPLLGERITLLQASAVDQIQVQLSDGDTVVWGSAEQSQLKAQVLSVLLSQEASVYDVSAPHAPTTR